MVTPPGARCLLSTTNSSGASLRRYDGREIDTAGDGFFAVAPLTNPVFVDFVSERVGNYQHHPLWGILLDQLWVQ